MEKSFGDILKELRERRGLSLNQFAIYAGVSSGLVSKLENGKRGTPKPETIEKLAKGLKIDYSELMKLAGYDIQVNVNKDTEIESLPESEIDRVIREAEAHYGVNLRDDPHVNDMLRELIHSIAKMKQK